jgi:hypothetical protein
MDEKVKVSPAIIFIKKYLPFMSFGLLIVILLITTNLTGRIPVISTITPNTGFPGSELVVNGKYFGKERKGGKVQVSGISLASDAYQEWKDTKIKIIIPEEMNSGLLKVVTLNGESKEVVPFVNKKHIPIPIIGPQVPGEVYIKQIEPQQGSIGSLITVTGMNFKDDRGNSKIYFEWISSDKRQSINVPGFASSLPAAFYDYDYESWTDTEIKVRVPDGAASGNVFISTDTGTSNSHYFEVKESVGKKQIGQKKIYQVYYWVKIKIISAEPENGLTIWLPEILQTPDQREVTLITCEPSDPQGRKNGIMEFSFKDLQSGDSKQIKLRFILSKYEVRTNIEANMVRIDYDPGKYLYRMFTRPDSVIPSSDFRIMKLSKQTIGKEKNPYLKALALYNLVENLLNHPQDQDSTDHDILKIIESQRPVGDSYVYSMLFCALLRSVGVPARPVAGYLACSDLTAIEHYWAEYFLEDYGWIPVDPILGDGKRYKNYSPEGNARNYYFGNLDNNHITFTRGFSEIEKKSVSDRAVVESRFASLQSVYEESVGKINSYSSDWSSLGIVGVY